MIIMIIMMLISIYFIKSKHPLSMGITLIFQSICISMLTGMISSFLFSYIMMMIMLSGMLVLFMYMSNVASNEKFYMTSKNSLLILLIPLLMMKQDSIMYNLHNYKTNSTMKYDISTSLSKLFSSEMVPLIMMMVLYLFFTMIVISSIVNIHEGPMRSKS
nr:NADH dehydrogenase subunit 6 [Cimex lectularius]